MLPDEIAPYATAHQKALDSFADQVKAIFHRNTPLTHEECTDMVKQLNSHRQAFERFKVCMADEVKQKESYNTYAKENGYRFS